MPQLTRNILFLALVSSASAFAATNPTSTVITACVGKIGGLTRIVNAPKDCSANLETVLQFAQTGPAGPQGPTGPAGPQGPAGPSNNAPFLVRTVIVPAGGTPQANGQYLAEIIDAVESVASDTNPYLIQLDAGFFVLPNSGVTINNGISLKGAGVNSTSVSSGGIVFNFVSTSRQTVSTDTSFSLSDMTIQSPDISIFVQNYLNVSIDRVHADAFVGFNSASGIGSLLITDSTLGGPLSLAYGSRFRTRIVGTQVSSFYSSTQAAPAHTLGCFAAYNGNLVPYSSSCQ